MKVRLMISGGFLAIACAWTGCAQSKAIRSDQVSTVGSSDSKALAEKSESGVVKASHTSLDDALAGPRVSLRHQLVIFKNPGGEAALKRLWGDTVTASSNDTDRRSTRSRVVASEQISATLRLHKVQGVAGIRPESSTTVTSGSAIPWKDEIQRDYNWQVTPTVRSAGRVHVSITGQVGKRRAGSKRGNEQHIAVESNLSRGQTLIVEGLDREIAGMEVAQVPILGDIPLVGPLLFSKMTTHKETWKTLYLVTAEIAAESDASHQPK